MLDIALIRSKPDWVKEQIAKLNDDGALARIDAIVTLDAQRRETRTRIETAQAARNKLNRAMGVLRGNKGMPDQEKANRAQLAAAALGTRDYDRASRLMDGSEPAIHDEHVELNAAFNELIRELRIMGDEIEEGFQRIESIESELQENMLWLPNLPHESVPVFERSRQHPRPDARQLARIRLSSPSRIGSWVRRWTSSTSSAASSWRAAVTTRSRVGARVCSGR